MTRSLLFIVAAATLFAGSAQAGTLTGTVKLKVVGYRADGIDTSSSTSSETKTVNVADIREVTHPSSWYYAVETKRGTMLASEMTMAVGGKTATFTGTDINPPQGSAANLVEAAHRQLNPGSPIGPVSKGRTPHGRKHHH